MSMIKKMVETVTGSLEDKKQWKQYKARVAQLPTSYRTTAEALERYLMHFGPGTWDSMSAMFEDLADLLEQAAADGTPIRSVVGADPVEFAEEFLRNYPAGQWISKERARLTKAIDSVADDGETL